MCFFAINDINTVGRIVSEYYVDPERVLSAIKNGTYKVVTVKKIEETKPAAKKSVARKSRKAVKAKHTKRAVAKKKK